MSRIVVRFSSRTLSILRVIVHFWSSASGPSIANIRTLRTPCESRASVTFASARLAPLSNPGIAAEFLSVSAIACAAAAEIAEVPASHEEWKGIIS
jgi:hypothetical protein